MKTLLVTTAVVLSLAGSAFADRIDGSLNTNNNNGAINHTDSNNTDIGGDSTIINGTHSTTTVESSAMNGYVSNPNLTTSGADTCFGSSSGGISAAGIGISGGKTIVDENCVMLKNAKLLSSLGLKDAAVSLLINSNPDIAKAISQAYPQLVIKLHGVTNEETLTNDSTNSN